jgi:hypothetical protein
VYPPAECRHEPLFGFGFCGPSAVLSSGSGQTFALLLAGTQYTFPAPPTAISPSLPATVFYY